MFRAFATAKATRPGPNKKPTKDTAKHLAKNKTAFTSDDISRIAEDKIDRALLI